MAETRALLEQNQLQDALQAIWSLVTRANQYVDQTAPFKLAKDPAQAERLDEVLYNLAEICRILAVLLWPFLPGTAGRFTPSSDCPGAGQAVSGALGRPAVWSHDWRARAAVSAERGLEVRLRNDPVSAVGT